MPHIEGYAHGKAVACRARVSAPHTGASSLHHNGKASASRVRLTADDGPTSARAATAVRRGRR